jgi:cytochrome P460
VKLFQRAGLFTTLCLSTVICGCSKLSGTQVGLPIPEPAVAEIAKNYQDYRRITAQPVLVNPELAMLCVGASKAQVDSARTKFGPHANTSITIYMNDLARTAFRDRRLYPVGAVVVKCKKLLGYGGHAENETGVGGMVKRPSGYDSTHGDWEYFYFEQPKSVESGRISSCVQCHDAAKTSDFVFGTWVRGSDRN